MLTTSRLLRQLEYQSETDQATFNLRSEQPILQCCSQLY
jgi:hypothetical protein